MLKEMYDGKITPWERHNPNADKQLEITHKISALDNDLSNMLPPEGCKKLKELSDLYEKLYDYEESELFAYGFSTGLFLMQDATNIAKLMLTDVNPSGKAAD
jgi:hypothetical protein